MILIISHIYPSFRASVYSNATNINNKHISIKLIIENGVMNHKKIIWFVLQLGAIYAHIEEGELCF